MSAIPSKIASSNKNFFLLLLFGFSSGLPFLLIRGTLQAWMTDLQIDIKTIGLASLVGWPFVLKPLWSPLLERYRLPLLGRRRGWIAASQVLVAVTILLMSLFQTEMSLWLLLLAAFLVAISSATQDITLDGMRREVLTDRQLGTGTSFFVTGYRIAILIAGAGALYLSDSGFSWPQIYQMMAVLMLIGVCATLCSEEPVPHHDAPKGLFQAIVLPYKNLLSRKHAVWILTFVLLYKLGDVMATSLQTRFVLGMGNSKIEVARITKIYGFGATLLGGFIAGLWMTKISLNQALWIFGFLQSATIVGFYFVAESTHNPDLLTIAVATESFAAALGTSAFIAYLGSLCDKRYSITQYALLSSLMAVPGTILSACSGYLQAALGWPLFFAVCIAMAVPGMMILVKIAPYKAEPETAS